jgi:hypothetical protein
VLELKLPPFVAALDDCPDVQLRLLQLTRHTTLPRLRPHSIGFVGIGEHPAAENADDSQGLAAGLAVYELPQSCLAEYLASLPHQRLGYARTVSGPWLCDNSTCTDISVGCTFSLLQGGKMMACAACFCNNTCARCR